MARKRRKLVEKTADLTAGAVGLGVGASVAGSVPGVPENIESNILRGFGVASAGFPIAGAGIALSELRSLERLGKKKRKRR